MMNAETGCMMEQKAHIAQSIKNILFTRIGTRVQREEYGSLLPELLDAPLTPEVVLMCYAAIVMAISMWEPRVTVKSVDMDAEAAALGKIKITLEVVVGGRREIIEVRA